MANSVVVYNNCPNNILKLLALTNSGAVLSHLLSKPFLRWECPEGGAYRYAGYQPDPVVYIAYKYQFYDADRQFDLISVILMGSQ